MHKFGAKVGAELPISVGISYLPRSQDASEDVRELQRHDQGLPQQVLCPFQASYIPPGDALVRCIDVLTDCSTQLTQLTAAQIWQGLHQAMLTFTVIGTVACGSCITTYGG